MTNHLNVFRNRSRTVACAATAGAAAALLAACGATTVPGSPSLPTLPAGLGSSPSASASLGPTSGNLGDTLTMMDAGDDIAHVTLVKVFDPATGLDPDDTPPDGTRWVAFEGTIVINGARSGEELDGVRRHRLRRPDLRSGYRVPHRYVRRLHGHGH